MFVVVVVVVSVVVVFMCVFVFVVVAVVVFVFAVVVAVVVRDRDRGRVHGHVRARVRVRRSKKPRLRESEPEGYEDNAEMETEMETDRGGEIYGPAVRRGATHIAVKGEFECEGVGEGVGEGERREAGSAPNGIQDIDDTSSIHGSVHRHRPTHRQPESKRAREHRPTQPVDLVIVCLDIQENPPRSKMTHVVLVDTYEIWEDIDNLGGRGGNSSILGVQCDALGGYVGRGATR
ncbi:hypothetical protein BDN70DRAFT_926136 [Pholiota conissans]|uniref:Uncharacterized protein n=1 Tax=Pholiota conissans TaxID=109636 RepID=A0A9P5YKE9_9AGAR|nr:hypothetical protein BDN70DRAFT_926136 [Pholiota conissans]